jgi:hypothetical protein
MPRKIIIAFMLTLFITALLLSVYLNISYQHKLPRSPQPNIGREIAHNIHGTIVYLTESEKKQLDALFWVDLVSFGILAITIKNRRE